MQDLHYEFGKDNLVADSDCPGVKYEHALGHAHDSPPERATNHLGIRHHFESYHKF